MIFIPKEKVERERRENGEELLVWNYSEEYIISFLWRRTPKININTDMVELVADKDPFYLEVVALNYNPVMRCSSIACNANPHLRYNKIIDKWYCNCPSSAICTENNDKSEIEELLTFSNGEYTKENGFYDNPIEAILMWNITMSKNCLEEFQDELKEFEERNKK